MSADSPPTGNDLPLSAVDCVPDTHAPDASTKPQATNRSICDLPYEIFIQILCLSEDLSNLSRTCKKIHALVQDTRTLSTWFMERYGKPFAIAHAIARRKLFTTRLFQTLITHGALLPRALVQEIISRWGKSQKEQTSDRWGAALEINAYMAVLTKASEMYGEGINSNETDHAMFSRWLFKGESPSIGPFELAKQFNFIPQPFCGTDQWLHTAIVKDGRLATEWGRMGLRFSNPECTAILKKLLLSEKNSTEGSDKRQETLQKLMSYPELGFTFDKAWAQSIISDLALYACHRQQFSHEIYSHSSGMTQNGGHSFELKSKVKSSVELLKALGEAQALEFDLYDTVKGVAHRLLSAEVTPGYYGSFLRLLAVQFPTLPSDLGPVWFWEMLFHHQHEKYRSTTPHAAEEAVELMTQDIWASVANSMTSLDVLEFMLHPLITSDTHMLDIVKSMQEARGVVIIPDWPAFLSQLIKNFFVHPFKARLLESVYRWSQEKLKVSLKDEINKLILQNAIPRHCFLEIIGPQIFALSFDDSLFYGKARLDRWSSLPIHRIWTLIGIEDPELKMTQRKDLEKMDRLPTGWMKHTSFFKSAETDPQIVPCVPWKWVKGKEIIELANRSGTSIGACISDVYPSLLVSAPICRLVDITGAAFADKCLSTIFTGASIGETVMHTLSIKPGQELDVILDHALITSASAIATHPKHSYTAHNRPVFHPLVLSCLTKGAKLRPHHFEIFAAYGVGLPQYVKEDILKPGGFQQCWWGEAALYRVDAELTPSEKANAKAVATLQPEPWWTGDEFPVHDYDLGNALLAGFEIVAMPSPLRKDSRDMECDGPIGPFDDPGLVSQSSETDDGTSLEIWTPYEPLRRARDRMHLELVKGKEVPKACCEDKSSLADLAQRQQCGGATTPTNEKDESDSSSTLSSPPASVANPPLAGESPGRSRSQIKSRPLTSGAKELQQSTPKCSKGSSETSAQSVAQNAYYAAPIAGRTRGKASTVLGRERIEIKLEPLISHVQPLTKGGRESVIFLANSHPYEITENERRRCLRNAIPFLTFFVQLANVEAKKRAIQRICAPKPIGAESTPFEKDLKSVIKSLQGLVDDLEAAAEPRSRKGGANNEVLEEVLALQADIKAQDYGGDHLEKIKLSLQKDEKRRKARKSRYKRTSYEHRKAFNRARGYLNELLWAGPKLLEEEPEEVDKTFTPPPGFENWDGSEPEEGFTDDEGDGRDASAVATRATEPAVPSKKRTGGSSDRQPPSKAKKTKKA